MGLIFDKQKLIGHLRQLVGSAIFYRGENYWEHGFVGRIRISQVGKTQKIKAEAKVQGSEMYKTGLVFDLDANNFSQLECSCPFDWGECKHSIALGLKFLDIYEDFVSRGLVFDNQAEKMQAINDFFQNVGNNKEMKFEEEYALAEAAKINEAEIISEEYSENRDENLKLKELLESIGLDAGKLPDQMLEYLKGLKKGNEIKKPTLKNKIQKRSNTFSEKYYLLVSHGYGYTRLNIEMHDEQMYFWRRLMPKDILEDENDNLTEEEKILLETLQKVNYWEHQVDWGQIFSLAKNIGLRVYLERSRGKSELKFGDDEIAKIPVTLSFRQEKCYTATNYSDFLDLPKFSMELDGNFGTMEVPKLLAGKDNLVLLDNKQINFYPSNPILFAIFSVMPQEDHYNKARNIWKADFKGRDIIRINEIILALKDKFKLKTNLTPDFAIKKFAKPRPVVSINYDALQNKLKVALAMDYGFDVVDLAFTSYRKNSKGKISFETRWDFAEKKFHMRVEGKEISYAPFDFAREKKLFKEFAGKQKFGLSLQLRAKKSGQKQIAQYILEYWPALKGCGYPVVFLRDKPEEFFEGDFWADFKVDLNAEADLLAFDVACYCGENRLTLEDLKKYLKNKDEFIRMNDGRLLKISNWADLERFVAMLESFYEKENGQFEGRTYHAPELQNIFTSSPHYNAKLAKGFQRFMKEAQNGRPVEKIKFPKKIQDSLRHYQKDGVGWFYFLRKYRFAGILADDMGLGKTLQALALTEMNLVQNKPSIVVCPKTLLFNWEEEAKKFFPQMKVLVIDGTPEIRKSLIRKLTNYDLVVTSYVTLKKDLDFYEQQKVKFNYCFLDEAQFVKNHKTQNAQAVKKIPADYRLALTGTPLENSVSEIWSIFDFLMPGFLGNHSQFVKRFQTPIMKENSEQALQELHKKVECFMLRRTKVEVLKELPPKIEQTITCELEEAQNILYQEILANVKNDLFKTVQEKGFAKSQIHILAGLTKLRQVCNHPALLLKNKDYAKYESAKLGAFSELIDEIILANRKVLVFSQFTKMLDILEDVLEKKGIEYLYLSGQTKNRKELVHEFNANVNKKVFLISLKAGGVGLNLTSADNVIIFDPWWNPSVENQAIDRTHRIGQKNSVNVYRLVTKGTIEEKILKLQEKKKFLFDNLIGESKDLFQKLTWDDVRDIFD